MKTFLILCAANLIVAGDAHSIRLWGVNENVIEQGMVLTGDQNIYSNGSYRLILSRDHKRAWINRGEWEDSLQLRCRTHVRVPECSSRVPC